MAPCAIRWHQAHRAAERPEVPHGRRLGGPCQRLDSAAALARAGQAVLRVLRAGPDPRTASAPKEWIAKFKGQFDQGWDQFREQTLARQIELGVVPVGTQTHAAAQGNSRVGHAVADQKRLYAHMMEVYAASLAYVESLVV